MRSPETERMFDSFQKRKKSMKKKSIDLKNRQIFPIPKPGSAIQTHVSALQTQVDEDVTNENLPTIVQTDK